MAITELYSDYFQKSKTFLLPAIGIRRCEQTADMMTFIEWPGEYGLHDYRLIVCRTDIVRESEYLRWEAVYLFNNPYFETVKWLDTKTIAYVFNLEKFKNDWELFLQGKYSQLSPVLKERIKCYYDETSYEWEYVKSFLFPERYFTKYAELLYDEKDRERGEAELRAIGELCQPYTPDMETIKFLEPIPVEGS